MRDYKFCPLCGAPLQSGIIDGKRRGYCPQCAFVAYKNPIPSVGAIAIMDGKVLLVKRGEDPGKGSWAPPSGFMESGETPEEACLRELKEETGMVGVIKGLIGVYLERTKIYGEVLVIVYLVDITGGELKPGDDAEDTRFFLKEDQPKLHFGCFRKAIEKVF